MLTLFIRIITPPYFCQNRTNNEIKVLDILIITWRVLCLLQLNFIIFKINQSLSWDWFDIFLLIWLFLNMASLIWIVTALIFFVKFLFIVLNRDPSIRINKHFSSYFPILIFIFFIAASIFIFYYYTFNLLCIFFLVLKGVCDVLDDHDKGIIFNFLYTFHIKIL